MNEKELQAKLSSIVKVVNIRRANLGRKIEAFIASKNPLNRQSIESMQDDLKKCKKAYNKFKEDMHEVLREKEILIEQRRRLFRHNEELKKELGATEKYVLGLLCNLQTDEEFQQKYSAIVNAFNTNRKNCWDALLFFVDSNNPNHSLVMSSLRLKWKKYTQIYDECWIDLLKALPEQKLFVQQKQILFDFYQKARQELLKEHGAFLYVINKRSIAMRSDIPIPDVSEILETRKILPGNSRASFTDTSSWAQFFAQKKASEPCEQDNGCTAMQVEYNS